MGRPLFPSGQRISGLCPLFFLHSPGKAGFAARRTRGRASRRAPARLRPSWRTLSLLSERWKYADFQGRMARRGAPSGTPNKRKQRECGKSDLAAKRPRGRASRRAPARLRPSWRTQSPMAGPVPSERNLLTLRTVHCLVIPSKCYDRKFCRYDRNSCRCARFYGRSTCLFKSASKKLPKVFSGFSPPLLKKR